MFFFFSNIVKSDFIGHYIRKMKVNFNQKKLKHKNSLSYIFYIHK
jgi:hypothetical protein